VDVQLVELARLAVHPVGEQLVGELLGPVAVLRGQEARDAHGHGLHLAAAEDTDEHGLGVDGRRTGRLAHGGYSSLDGALSSMPCVTISPNLTSKTKIVYHKSIILSILGASV